MQEVAVVGLDLAKNVFQVHGLAPDGGVVVRRQLRRAQVIPFFEALAPCLIGMEACASAFKHGPWRSWPQGAAESATVLPSPGRLPGCRARHLWRA